MKIAVLSGKGGTGKTFVSVNLASVMKRAVYIDCDVEEPNGRLFLKPEHVETQSAFVLNPSFDREKCTGCRKCMDFCKFNALVYIRDTPKLFPGICHSCGGCSLVCPEGAVTEVRREVGKIETGVHGELQVVTGIMNLSEESGVSVISRALEIGLQRSENAVIDCPPGSACTVMESIREADYCILVAEPTSFGLHNLKMVIQLVKTFHKPCGIVINKEVGEYREIFRESSLENIPVLLRIPYDTELAGLCAKGGIAAEENRTYHEMFEQLFHSVRREMGL